MSPTTDLVLRIGTAVLLRVPLGARKALAGRRVVLDGNTLDPTTQLMLRSMKLTGKDSIARSPDVAHNRERLRQSAGLLTAKTAVGQVRDFEIPGPAGAIPVRHYRPDEGIGALLVFFHGGGFVMGDLDTHDQACRQTCHDAKVSVLSVDYRLAPEHKAPAGVEDSFAAYLWAVEHAVELGASAPDRVAVGGDSAGGNLAAVVSQLARDAGAQLPALQFLIYPVVDSTVQRRSRELFREGFYLTREAIDWCDSQYLGGSGLEAADPRVSPLLADDLAGLPPALVATAGFDPLRDEGNEYAERLRAAGVPADLRVYGSLIHGFYNMAPLGGGPAAAVAELTSALRAHLSRR
ncbi:MAG: alpha/beta hydrolase [Segniliparus sp.]|uniref:alpha/beta hydrolase n=1 Tax=Segniliparus sp. TaxID=2804064 RepID=UPI003F384767